MAYWLVYERCDHCEKRDCLQCHEENRSLTLRVVQADDMPERSLNGPCATPQEILTRMGQFFGFNEATGKMYFKVEQK